MLVNAQNLTDPTVQSFKQYSRKRFAKIVSLISRTNIDTNIVEIKINTEYNRRKKIFTVKAVLKVGGRTFVVRFEDRDFRRAIDLIVNNLRKQMVEKRGKDWLNYH